MARPLTLHAGAAATMDGFFTRDRPMPDFRSDTVTSPLRHARRHAGGGAGRRCVSATTSVNALQDHAAQLLGFEAALFAPSAHRPT